MNIRRAEKGDIEGILKLLLSVSTIHKKLRPDLFILGKTKYTEAELVKMIENDENPIFIAEVEGFTAGYIFCEIKENLPANCVYGNKELYIDDLCVDEKFRGKGVAKALLEHVKNYAVSGGFDYVTLNVWEGNERAEAFYKKEGFFPRKTMLEIALR